MKNAFRVSALADSVITVMAVASAPVRAVINGVPPLDRNRLTREWFQSGRAVYVVSGPGPNLFPGGSIKADLGNGPGVQEVSTSKVNVSGASGTVAVSDAHGTVTGAAGGVLLRPFALDLQHR